jgi:curved DNA-binding protein CbpA
MCINDYFKDCKSLQDVKSKYKKLARENHPDFGGYVAEMQKINAAFDEAVKYFEKHGTTYERKQAAAQTPEKFREVVEKLLKMPKLKFDIVGSWIWITDGAAFYQRKLSAMGFKYSSKHKKYYLADESSETTGFRKRATRYSMNDIKDIYGCMSYESETEKQLA